MKTFMFEGTLVEAPAVYDRYPPHVKVEIDKWVASLRKQYGERLHRVRITKVAHKCQDQPLIYGMYSVDPPPRRPMDTRLGKIKTAFAEYEDALAAREHGLVAAHRFIDKVKEILG